MGIASFDRRTLNGLGLLVVGQLFFWANLGAVYFLALLLVCVGLLPYPKIFRSLLSRAVTGFLLLISIVQVAGAVQFFVAPHSDFALLSLLTTTLLAGLVVALAHIPRRPLVWLNRYDGVGLIAAACLVVPLLLLSFWQNDPTRLAALASVQGVDGSNHYTMIAQMAQVQHLDYRDTTYYPKGFHLASAFLLHMLHANQQDQRWAANARTYVLMFIAWGGVLLYMLMYVAMQLWEGLALRLRPSLPLMALTIGGVATFIYLFAFVQEGFLSYLYVVAALLCGVIYIGEMMSQTRHRQWLLTMYFLVSFGIAMSWGPLLTPALLLVPVLSVAPEMRPLGTLLQKWMGAEWRWAALAFVAQAIPPYLHVRYAHLSSQQGLNATGGLKIFDYGVVVADLTVLGYMLCARNIADPWRQFASNVILPFFLLTGGLVCYQYLSVGELRYYAIKTSYALELLMLAPGVMLFGAALTKAKLSPLHRWLAMPVLVGLGVVVLCGLTANPFDHARILVGTLTHQHQPSYVVRYTELGMEGRLNGSATELRYDPAANALIGDAVLAHWADTMQFTPSGKMALGACTQQLFDLEVGPPSKNRNDEIVHAVKDCAARASQQKSALSILTDTASLPYLRAYFGDTVAYIY